MVRRSLNLRLAMVGLMAAVATGAYDYDGQAETGKVLENVKEGKHPD